MNTKFQAQFCLVSERNPTAKQLMLPFELQSQQDNEFKSAINYLAINRQIFLEAKTFFYSMNRFHLPPGPPHSSGAYFDRLAASSRLLIKHIAVRISLDDFPINLMPRDWFRFGSLIRTSLKTSLHRVWQNRISWACGFHKRQKLAGVSGLETITFCAAGVEPLILSGEALQDALSWSDDNFWIPLEFDHNYSLESPCRTQMLEFMGHAYLYSMSHLLKRAREDLCL